MDNIFGNNYDKLPIFHSFEKVNWGNKNSKCQLHAEIKKPCYILIIKRITSSLNMVVKN